MVRLKNKDRPRIDLFTFTTLTLIVAIHRDWGELQGNYDEFRFFTGMRPSEQIALALSDEDLEHDILSVSKACVAAVERDCTKTAEDRRIVLCPRALATGESERSRHALH